jgi:ABC-type transport system involved in multi-copper enzyme maturation permease subunit
LNITPILEREILVAMRRGKYWWSRASFAGILFFCVLVTFAVRYYRDHGRVSDREMIANGAAQALFGILLLHGAMIFGVFASVAAPSIAIEHERRTLDFLLSTRLSNAEIVLGKLAHSLVELAGGFAVGLPFVLLAHSLGGIDPWVILLAYAGLGTTAFFMCALALWASSAISNVSDAAGAAVTAFLVWLIVPFVVPMTLPTLGIRVPRLVLAANEWIVAGSPMSVLHKIGAGATPSSGLLGPLAWMCGLQSAEGVLLLIGAVAHLRPAYRDKIGKSGRELAKGTRRQGWRLFDRPAVGDDPILWRAIYTAREPLSSRVLGFAINTAIFALLGYVTYFFGRPAVIELWHHGYTAGLTSADRPEWNPVVRFFLSGPDVSPPADQARTEFNLYLRYITAPLALFIIIGACGAGGQGIMTERNRETWTSLIATPLTASDLLKSKLFVGLWRLRMLVVTLFVLWTIGLAAGAIHPIGYVFSVMIASAWIWLMLAYGLATAIAARDQSALSSRTLLFSFLTALTGVLPFVLPRGANSVVLGAGSPPLLSWLALVSYRDVRNAWHFTVYPAMEWMRIDSGEGAIPVVVTCLVGIITPLVWGRYLWRYALTNFDRLIGRPNKHECS